MATNEKRRSMIQMNRNSSAMSGTLNRNSSYGSASNYSYSRPMPPRLEARRSYGANGGYYNNGMSTGYQTFSPSPLASKGSPPKRIKPLWIHTNSSEGPSPTGSLNESSSSSSSRMSISLDFPIVTLSLVLDLVEMQYAAPAATNQTPASPNTLPVPTSHGMASPYAPPAPRRYEQTMMETIHGNPTRKLGEAPILSQPPPSLAKPIVVPTPVAIKKRSWGFGKRNSHSPAIAAH